MQSAEYCARYCDVHQYDIREPKPASTEYHSLAYHTLALELYSNSFTVCMCDICTIKEVQVYVYNYNVRDSPVTNIQHIFCYNIHLYIICLSISNSRKENVYI